MLIEDDFDVVMLGTKEKLSVFNFPLNQEHASDRTIFSLWLFCILRNSLTLLSVGLGHLQELPWVCDASFLGFFVGDVLLFCWGFFVAHNQICP